MVNFWTLGAAAGGAFHEVRRRMQEKEPDKDEDESREDYERSREREQQFYNYRQIVAHLMSKAERQQERAWK